ncbi:hypothetical protein L3V83_05510 [Thiotrichales bacterium 19X7-9]|nr:hypothetical protein [Thiotrichales bacterium 19X7-9]
MKYKTKSQMMDDIIKLIKSQILLNRKRKKDGSLSKDQKLIDDNLENLKNLLLTGTASNDKKKLNEITNTLKEKLNYIDYKAIDMLIQAYQSTNFQDVLISQKDGDRNGYLESITSENGLISKSGQSFSVFSTKDEKLSQLENKGISYQVKQELDTNLIKVAQKLGEHVKNNFGYGNNLEDMLSIIMAAGSEIEGSDINNRINVEAITEALDLDKRADEIMSHYKSLFVPPSGMNHLPQFFIDRQTYYHEVDQDKVRSVSRFPMYAEDYKAIDDNKSRAIGLDNFKETLVDFAFTLAALRQGKPIYGSCQGAHVGWLIAGMEMTKFNKYNWTPDEILPEHDDKTRLSTDSYESNGTTLLNGKEMETDYQHATVMIHNPEKDKTFNPELEVTAMHELFNNNLDRNKAYAKKLNDFNQNELSKHTIKSTIDKLLSNNGSTELTNLEQNCEGVIVLKEGGKPLKQIIAPDFIFKVNENKKKSKNEYYYHGKVMSGSINGQPKITAIIDETAKQTQNIIQAQTTIEIAKNAVEEFKYKTLIGTQSHPFKHLVNENSFKYVSDNLRCKENKFEKFYNTFISNSKKFKQSNFPLTLMFSQEKNETVHPTVSP